MYLKIIGKFDAIYLEALLFKESYLEIPKNSQILNG